MNQTFTVFRFDSHGQQTNLDSTCQLEGFVTLGIIDVLDDIVQLSGRRRFGQCTLFNGFVLSANTRSREVDHRITRAIAGANLWHSLR